ncbi:L-xylulose 5-phosphate 3-epimerase [Salmonella enterica subsp. enterica]|nr:L-xylulose 5-phosphate 3-epimerase [Salmonella enterica subsp. enterica]
MRNHPLGIYEKALAKDLSWPERLVLAKSCGFDFVEMSVDETDERLSRLEWTPAQRASLVNAMLESGVAIPSMCLSAHRRFPFGSHDEAVRQRARENHDQSHSPGARPGGSAPSSWQVTTSITKNTTKAPSNVSTKGWRGRWNRPQRRR